MRNKICLIMIVRDEATNIRRTIESALPACDAAFIVDAGSTDGTANVAAETLNDWWEARDSGDWPWHVTNDSFDDFSSTRNRAMRDCEEWLVSCGKVPSEFYLLWMDGDTVLHNAEGILAELGSSINGNCQPDACYIQMHMGDYRYSMRRLLSAGKWEYRGRVHEVPYLIGDPNGSKDITDSVGWTHIEVLPSSKPKDRAYWLRHIELLELDWKDNPVARTAFYMAQTYECLEDWRAAYSWYSMRAAMSGYAEETFMATYRAGCIAERADREWRIAEAWLKRASDLDTQRAEPAYRIALHYYQLGDWSLTEHWSATAGVRQYPENRMLFLEPDVYGQRGHAADLLSVARHELALLATADEEPIWSDPSI